MNTKFLLSTILSIPFFIGNLSASSKPSDELKTALDSLNKSKVQCYCVCEFDGKSQLSAGTEMFQILEEELAENEHLPSVNLSNYINGFIGISSGSLLASHIALGGNSANVKEAISPLNSKMIAPKGVVNCLSCLGKTTQVASYFIDPTTEFDDIEKIEDNYDAIVLNSDAISAISHISSGTDNDLKTGLTILSTCEKPNFSEQILAAIKESDNAAKKNATKIAFDTLLETAQNITSLTIDVAGSRINKTAAEKALDIMTKIEEGVGKVDSALNNTLFKQNLVKNFSEPTAECPVVIIDLKTRTGNGQSIKTSMQQEFKENFVKVTYLTEIPLSMYPTKKLAFETVEPKIALSVRDCMQSIRLDSATSTDILTDFLTEVKLGKETA